MSRPSLEVADIFRGHGPAWRRANAGHVSLGQLKVMSAIESCRTAALGGHVARCEECAHTQISYNSCRNRHCPKCQGAAAKDWLAAREADLLPVPYYHVVFTLPAAIADIAYQNKAVIYDLLFKASAETLITIAADPKHLGARVGITSVLHTWGSAMTHHPHVHMIVPGGGISLDGESWISCRPGFFLPVRVLSRLFRRLFLEKLLAAHKAGHLKFFGDHAALADPQAFAAYLAPLRRAEWVVYAKRPFGGPQAVLAYLSRYTHRVAIANSRLIACDRTGVTFRWKDYRADGRDRQKVMTLATAEFIRRFLIHVLPLASTASATTACSPAARAPTTSPGRAVCSTCHRKAAGYQLRRGRRAQAALAPVSVLRWPHGRHRDIPARRLAALSAGGIHRRNQDRHIMIRSVRGNIPVVPFCFAASRPAMTMLAVAPPGTTDLVDQSPLRDAGSADRDRPTGSPHRRPLPRETVNAPRQQAASVEIPIASDAPPRHTSRGFLPWRFAYVGPRVAPRHLHGAAIRKPSQIGSGVFYSITSSARARSAGGISKPSALATLMLITNSILFGCSTGRSAGRAPLSILSTNVAAR